MKLDIYLFLLLAITLASCVDIPDYSDIPRIDYNGIQQRLEIDSTSTSEPQRKEIVTLTINFEDGTGDLGISEAQRQDSLYTQQYAQIPGWGYAANYELVELAQDADGNWKESVRSLNKFKFFFQLKLDGIPGPIKGKLDHNIEYPYSNSAKLQKRKFKVRVVDRAFHISNQTVESDEVLVPVIP